MARKGNPSDGKDKNKNPGRDPLAWISSLLVELNLTALARELSELLSRAEAGRWGYSEFLQNAMEIEQAARLSRKIQRRVRWSRLGPRVTLEQFDFSVRPKLSPQVVKELLTCRFIGEQRNVILVGRPSTGKTSVAKAIGHAACERRHSVFYTSMEEMLEGLHAARADGTYRKAFRRVAECELLLIDDAGFASLDRKQTNELFRLVCSRYRRRSTIIVTNLPFKKWGEFLPSPAQAVAIADRLVDQATILRFSGKAFRRPRDISGAPLDGEDE
jgi:DNA replication protein DnaC